ncbi:hypothetical protein MH928_17425 [Flavobacterium sp. WW92]|uniref:hypothetical protein n=1 Tax=unclassified Flavobacterium TaxID=196869 RepID=UPI0022246904|nr:MULTISPECIES: hypothetical protein [unclassified Flavobacterium]WDO13090.1 hypothetical protein MH928_17425 [Flavobacterium sp. WW92]
MSETLKRIKQYIDYKGISIRAFEIECGFSNGSFASQLKNNKTIGVDKLENILNKYTEINANWVLTGIGEMIASNPIQNVVSESTTDYSSNSNLQELIATQRELIKMQKEKIEALENKLKDDKRGKEKAS